MTDVLSLNDSFSLVPGRSIVEDKIGSRYLNYGFIRPIFEWIPSPLSFPLIDSMERREDSIKGFFDQEYSTSNRQFLLANAVMKEFEDRMSPLFSIKDIVYWQFFWLKMRTYFYDVFCFSPFKRHCYILRYPIIKLKDRYSSKVIHDARTISSNVGDNLFHCETGPAIEWPDGYKTYYLNDVLVDPWMVETPAEKIDVEEVLKVENVEARRELIRKMGIDLFIHRLGNRVKVVDRDEDYSLLEIEGVFRRTAVFLRMKNPSIGTWHIEGVDPDCRTVQEAINWRRYGHLGRKWNPLILT